VDAASPEEVADALVLIGLALRAGLPLIEALCHVRTEARGRVRTDLAAVVAALRWGRTAQEAWEFAGPQWLAAARATHLSEHTGAAPAVLIEAAAARLRVEHERGRERAAARAGVLLVLPLGLGFLPAFACTAVVPVVLNLATTVLGGGA
jgi:pilus assembly protein TadC